MKTYCGIVGKKHIPEYLGLVFVDWDDGFCQDGYQCRVCGFKAQKPVMFAPEALYFMNIYPDAVEQKFIHGELHRRRARGEWVKV